MAFNFANDTAKNLLDLGLSPLFNTGSIELRTGTQPTSADDAVTGTLLVTIILPNPAFGSAVDSSPGATATANAIAQATAVATGLATYGRALTTGSATIADLEVGVDITISNTSIATNDLVDVTSFTLFQPEAAP